MRYAACAIIAAAAALTLGPFHRDCAGQFGFPAPGDPQTLSLFKTYPPAERFEYGVMSLCLARTASVDADSMYGLQFNVQKYKDRKVAHDLFLERAILELNEAEKLACIGWLRGLLIHARQNHSLRTAELSEAERMRAHFHHYKPVDEVCFDQLDKLLPKSPALRAKILGSFRLTINNWSVNKL